jgi:hypothetical protein
MKKTNSLRVYTDLSLPKNRIIIHPNDGFDLGLTNKNKSCIIYLNAQDDNLSQNNTGVPAFIVLDNNCTAGTMSINAKIWKDIGKPHKAILACKGNNFFLITKLMQNL